MILRFIKSLAEYEKLLGEVTADEKALEESLFDKGRPEVIIAEYSELPIGFALFFHNYSTFLGKPGIYLEDLYIEPEYRGKGFGKKLLALIANICLERGCGRLECWVLDWNKPSIAFYKSIRAIPMDEWTTFRMTGVSINNLAKEL